jgi:hypothetical protein
VNIEEELRKAFQAGQAHGAVAYGQAQTLNEDMPPNEDEYVRKALYELSLNRVIGLVEGKPPSEPGLDEIVQLGKEAMKRNHPELYNELVESGEIDA